MLLSPVKVSLITHVHFARKKPVPISARSSERHQGAGNLSLMGIRNVCFEVSYDIVLIRVIDTAGAAGATLSGRVHGLARSNGHSLPEGVYSLDQVPECRLAHFGGRWSLHFS